MGFLEPDRRATYYIPAECDEGECEDEFCDKDHESGGTVTIDIQRDYTPCECGEGMNFKCKYKVSGPDFECLAPSMGMAEAIVGLMWPEANLSQRGWEQDNDGEKYLRMAEAGVFEDPAWRYGDDYDDS